MKATSEIHTMQVQHKDNDIKGAILPAGLPPKPTHRAVEWSRILGLREMGVYYALILLVVTFAVASAYTGTGNYLTLQNMVNVVYQSSLTAIIAVAMTVILISGNFDLSVASVAALSAAVMIGLADSLGFVPACAVAMLVAVAAGLLNGAIVQLVGINAFIVTLGTMTALRGMVLIYTDGRSLSVENQDVIDAMHAFESGSFPVGLAVFAIGILLVAGSIYAATRSRRTKQALSPASVGMAFGAVCLLAVSWFTGLKLELPKAVVYMLAFAAVVWFVLTFTITGRRLYAVGGNAEAARLSGINVMRYKLVAFVLCSAAAGFAGILFASRLRSVNPGALNGAELTVIASAILGGTSLFGGAGSVCKTVAGALMLFTLTNGFNVLNLGVNYQGLLEGTVVVAAAAIYTVGGSRRGGKKH